MLKQVSNFVLGSKKNLNVAQRLRLRFFSPAALLENLFQHPRRSEGECPRVFRAGCQFRVTSVCGYFN